MAVEEGDRIDVAFQVGCYVRSEDRAWLAGCPALDLVTQAESKQAAKAALQEAVEMWIDSCLDRDTLAEALRELGWHRVSTGEATVGAGVSALMAPPEAPARILGEAFQLTLRIPA